MMQLAQTSSQIYEATNEKAVLNLKQQVAVTAVFPMACEQHVNVTDGLSVYNNGPRTGYPRNMKQTATNCPRKDRTEDLYENLNLKQFKFSVGFLA